MPELATILFGTQTAVVPTEDAQRPEWARAYDQWRRQHAPSTQLAYRRAWRNLIQHTGKKPWSLDATDIRGWAQDLQQCYAPATVAQYLAAVNSFYRYTREDHLVKDPAGRDRALLDGPNPAKTVKRPQVEPFGKAIHLDHRQLHALLDAIPQHTLQGKRDYALFLGYILTTRRNAEWRQLRWSHIEQHPDHIAYRWNGKRRHDQRAHLVPPVWDAILTWLTACEQIDHKTVSSLQSTKHPEPVEGCDFYIFPPLSDSARHLPNVNAAAWDRHHPLSASQVNRLLKKYARRAGIDETGLHVHVLRHSGAMLRRAVGDDLQAISDALGHQTIATTQIYIDHLQGVQDRSWREVTALLNLDLIGGHPHELQP